MNSTFDLTPLIEKTQDVLKRKEVSLTLSKIAKDHYTERISRRYSLESWLERGLVEERMTSEKLVLTAYLLELVGVKLISAEKSNIAQQSLSHAAKIFEYTGIYLDLPNSYRVNLLRHAAVCYDTGGYPCNSIVMADKVLDDLESRKEPMETIPRFLFLTNSLIFSFLARKFTDIKSLYKSIMAEKTNVQEVIKSIESDREKTTQLVRFFGFLESAEAIYNFCQFLIAGKHSYLKKSHKAIERSIHIFLDANDSENFALTTLLSIVMNEIQKRSVWRSIKDWLKGHPEYLKQLVNSDPPIVELWTSQIKAIESGLLEKERKNFVVSMPTSAGKTLIAELAIMKSLMQYENSTCIYVAPNKALALQVERDLMKRIARLGYKVSLVVGSYDHPEIEALKLRNCRVLITTPEKLSLLLKRKHPIVLSCKLFVFDEAQTLQTGGDRGIHIEFLLIRIRRLLPTSQIILLSAVISNPEQISSWIEKGKTQAVSIDWHPTRTLQAILHEGRVEYYDEMEDMKLNFPETRGKTLMEKAVILAGAYQSLGPVLIFCNTKLNAEKIAKRLNERVVIPLSENSKKRLKQLADRVKAQFGASFALSEFLENGVAYHHADLPSEIRSEIEELVRTGDIRLISSTTTLAEGINTPVSTVIIPYLGFQGFSKGRWEYTPITKMLYRNIAGRAGRALENTEGHVVLVRRPGKPLSETTKYLKSSRQELEPVESALKELATDGTSAQKINFNDKKVLAYQTEILSTICDQVIEKDDISSLIELTFFGHRVSKESTEYNTLKKHTSMQLERLHEKEILTHSSPYKPTDLGAIFNETGLSPESCELLLKEIELLGEKRKNFKIPIDPNIPHFHRRLLDLLRLAFIPLEVRSSDTYKSSLPNAEILLDWIFGKSVIQIAKDYFRKKPFDKAVLEAFAYSYVQLSYYAPWVLWAITKLLDYRGIEYSWPVKMLPAFAKYGTNDIVVVYCSALRISNRKAARKLAEKYRKAERKISFKAFMDWLHSLSREDVSEIITDRNIRDIVYSDIEKSKEYVSTFS